MAAANQFTTVAEVYDNLMSVVPYARWVDYVELLWERFGTAPRSVLDLACGTGNVLIELRGRGYEVAGADKSPGMLRQAARKTIGEVPLTCQDMRELDLPRTFDACVCLFDSVNYLLKRQHLRQTFAAVRRHLNPGGLFIFDMNTIRALETGMFNQEGTGADASLLYLWRSGYDPATRLCTIEMDFTVRTDGNARTFHETHVQRGYMRAEVEDALERAALQPLACYASFTLSEPTARSDRFHFVARR